VIERDGVGFDERQFVRVEVELASVDAALEVLAEREIGVGRKVVALVVNGELAAPDMAVVVVERREDRDIAELAGIQIVPGDLEEAVLARR